MAEYITKDQVVEWFRPYGHTDEGIPFSTLKADVVDMPAADVAPVKHGRWVELTNCASAGVYCSVCSKRVYAGDYARCNKRNKIRPNFCPNCGAKMMAGGTDDD